MKTTNQANLILTFIAAVAIPAMHNPAAASPGTEDRSLSSKQDVSHSEQGNFGIIGGGGGETGGIDREFGINPGMGGGFTLSGGDCPADWDGDGALTSTDVAFYFNDYFDDISTGTLFADFNIDLITNSSDVVEFINAWFLGCW